MAGYLIQTPHKLQKKRLEGLVVRRGELDVSLLPDLLPFVNPKFSNPLAFHKGVGIVLVELGNPSNSVAHERLKRNRVMMRVVVFGRE